MCILLRCQPDVYQALCSPGPMFPALWYQSLCFPCSPVPMLPRIFPVPLFLKFILPSPCVPQYLCFPYPPVPMFPSPYVFQSLCSPVHLLYHANKGITRSGLQDRVLGCTFTECKQPVCFPILHVRKVYNEGVFLMFFVSMLRTGYHAKTHGINPTFQTRIGYIYGSTGVF